MFCQDLSVATYMYILQAIYNEITLQYFAIILEIYLNPPML